MLQSVCTAGWELCDKRMEVAPVVSVRDLEGQRRRVDPAVRAGCEGVAPAHCALDHMLQGTAHVMLTVSHNACGVHLKHDHVSYTLKGKAHVRLSMTNRVQCVPAV